MKEIIINYLLIHIYVTFKRIKNNTYYEFNENIMNFWLNKWYHLILNLVNFIMNSNIIQNNFNWLLDNNSMYFEFIFFCLNKILILSD